MKGLRCNQPVKTSRHYLALVLLLFSCSASLQEQEALQLQEIQKQIEQTRQRLASEQQDAEALRQQLKQSELAESRLAQAIAGTEQQLTDTNQQLETLKDRQQQLQRQQKQQQQVLADTLASAYRTGSHDFAKMLLNLESPAKMERMLSYYGYLNEARIEQIQSLKQTSEDLLAVSAELEDKQQQLAQTKTRQEQQQASLAQTRANREQTLAQLNKSISSDEQRVAQLQEDEMRLAETIERLRLEAMKEPELLGLAEKKGKLSWPVKNRLRHKFGARKQGEVRWKGVVMRGRTGESVKSVARGKILYADWLNGYGLLVILDHGDGYMSLYGYNQTILGQVGDIVEAGETLALVGQSGGQRQAGLYFEIRHKGRALNPSRWCR